jgi:pimeloyl-ACP methyl ester carboxylesterase
MSTVARIAFVVSSIVVALAGPRAADAAACEVGAYRGPAGDFVAITEGPDTAQTRAWRYVFRDGRRGGTGDGTVACEDGAVLVAESRARWPRIALRTTVTRFRRGGVTLVGLLIEPLDIAGKPPLIVVGHGSERTAAIRRSAYPYIFAAQGISAFAFDKRGTGASGGSYTQSFARLADDLVAASVEARRLARGRHGRFGLFGGSQGGWVAPRAANPAGAQFVVVGFGLVLDPLEEDSEQVQTELRALGAGADVIAKAREVTNATHAVMASHFTAGYDQLAAARAAYGAEPWFAKIKGEFTGDLLAADPAMLRREGRARYDNLDIDWRYDAVGELRKVNAPLLWVVAGDDREAPPARTLERLQALKQAGRPIEIAVFPRTDHGMVEFVEAPDGTRTATRITDGYFRMLGDWVKQARHPPYGRAITP